MKYGSPLAFGITAIVGAGAVALPAAGSPPDRPAAGCVRSEFTRYQLLPATISALASITALRTATCELRTGVSVFGSEEGNEARVRRARVSASIVPTRTTPVRMPANSVGLPLRRRPFCRMTIANRPSSVPVTVPRPPKIEAPPSTTAVIAISS